MFEVFTHSDIVGANEGEETKALLDVSRLEHRLRLKRCCCCWSELDSEEGWNYFVILRLVMVTWATFNLNEFLRREIKKKTLNTKKWETRTQTTKKERNKVKGQPEMHLDLVLCFVLNLISHLFEFFVLNLISHLFEFYLFWIWSHICFELDLIFQIKLWDSHVAFPTFVMPNVALVFLTLIEFNFNLKSNHSIVYRKQVFRLKKGHLQGNIALNVTKLRAHIAIV